MDANYREYLQSPHWKEVREKRLEIDGSACVMCGSTEHLNVHHVSYLNVGNEDIKNDLVTLCSSCHAYVHENKNYVFYGLITAFLVMKQGLANDLVREHMKCLIIPIPGSECGALTVPFFDEPEQEEKLEEIAGRLQEDYHDLKQFAKSIYYSALKDGGYVTDIPSRS